MCLFDFHGLTLTRFHKNCIIFHEEVTDAQEVLWLIQILSWLSILYMCHWTLACSFANWCLQPFVVLGLLGFLFSFHHVFNISMMIYSFWESHFVVDAWVVLWKIQIWSWLLFIYMCHGTLACSFANWCLQPFVL